MRLTDEKREQAVELLRRNGRRVPIVFLRPPDNLTDMSDEERAVWETRAAEEMADRIDKALERVLVAAEQRGERE